MENKTKIKPRKTIESQDNFNWYVVYTKSRNEKKVSITLCELGIEAYCPTKKIIKNWSDRKKIIETPLFNSYCFVYLEEKNLRDVFKADGVVRYVYWCGKPAVVKPLEIETIKKWLNDYEHENLEVSYFKAEDKVKIKSGPFIDNQAKVISHNGNHLVLQLEGLGLRISTKINQTELAKVV